MHISRLVRGLALLGAILLAHHGLLTAGASVEEAVYLALSMERAAQLQLLASAAGEIKSIPPALAKEAHDFLLQPSLLEMAFEAGTRQIITDDPSVLDEQSC